MKDTGDSRTLGRGDFLKQLTTLVATMPLARVGQSGKPIERWVMEERKG